MRSNFVDEIMTVSPPLIDFVAHKKLLHCVEEAISFLSLCNGSSILLIVGPSHVGKSSLLTQIVTYLMNEVFAAHVENTLPVIGATALTSREGRTTPKYVYASLLQDARHPLHYSETLRCPSDYRPSRSASEDILLLDLRSAMRLRETRFVILDESQYLVRAKNPEFRASLLESMKSLVTNKTSLILAGGYETAEVALSMRAHLAARLVIVHLGRYTDGREDRLEWLKLLKSLSLSPRLRLSRSDLLISHADELLEQCLGVYGVLEKRLISCMMRSDALGIPIDDAILSECGISGHARDTMLADIVAGESVLRLWNAGATTKSKTSGGANEAKSSPSKARIANRGASSPFQRVASRARPKVKA